MIIKKILISALVGLVAMGILTTSTYAANKPLKICTPYQSGFDEWGYNYEANEFNGWGENISRPATLASNGDHVMMKWNDQWMNIQDCNNGNQVTGAMGSGAWLTNHAEGISKKLNISGTYIFSLTTFGLPQPDLYDVTLVEGSNGELSGNVNFPAGGPYNITLPIISGRIVGRYVQFDAGSILTGNTFHFEGVVGITLTMNGSWRQGINTGFWTTFSGLASESECTWSDFVKIVAIPSGSVLKVDNKWYSASGVEIGPAVWGDFAIIQENSSDSCDGSVGLLNYKSKFKAGLGNW